MRTSLAFWLAVLAWEPFAQSIDLHGLVTNKAGKPVANAIVVLQSNGLKDTSASDGSYSITQGVPSSISPSVHPIQGISLDGGALVVALDHPSSLQVELFDRYFPGMLVPHGKGLPVEQVIVNLLGGTAVREDKGDGFLSGGNWRCFRLTWRRLVGIWRQIRRHILRRRWTIVGLRCGGRCAPGVITGVIRRKRIAKVTGVSHKAIGQAGSIR